MRGVRLSFAIAATTLLGCAVGDWSQYPDARPPVGSLTALGIVIGGFVGLALASYFGPLVRMRTFILAWLLTVLAAIVSGVVSYGNRFDRGESVAWVSSFAFCLPCATSAIYLHLRNQHGTP